jgi:hypothetical protein
MSKYLEQLGRSLQSGDLSGAQSAFSSLQQLLPNSSANQAQTIQQTTQNTLNTDIATLGQALQTGDLSKAQDAFTKLRQDMQTAQKGHRHHHHHKAGNSQNSVSSSNSSSSAGSSANSGDSQSDTNINVIV